MQRRKLGDTGIEVSVLGFGCAYLTAQPKEEALKVLEAAYSQGITHFDVARLYGLGWAEGILGEFLRGKRDRVTVTTKFGLQPPGGLVAHRRLVYAAKKVLQVFPPVVRYMRKRAAQGVQGGRFTPEDARQSLGKSLKELRTDHVDMLLLHEATVTDAASEPLVHFLESQVGAGTVRCAGIGSDFAKLPSGLGALPKVYKVIQFNHNAHTRNLPRLGNRDGRALVTHTVFRPAGALAEALRAKPELAREFSRDVGIDPLDARAINSLLLHYNLQTNPDGMILFSSKNPAHVKSNAQEEASTRYQPSQIARFVQFVDTALSDGS